MNDFLKAFGMIAAIFTAVVAALAVFDGISNRNRIRSKYLECDSFEN